MKKFLLSLASLLLIGANAYADVVKDYEGSWAGKTEFGYWVGSQEGTSATVADEVAVLSNSNTAIANWQAQAIIAGGIPTSSDTEYTITLTIKGSAAGSLYIGLGDWGGTKGGNIKFTTEYQEVSVKAPNGIDGNAHVIAQWGSFTGSIYISKVVVTHETGGVVAKADADVTTFSKSKLSGNAWNFVTPADLSEYKYMIVTTVQSTGNMGGGMVFTDANNKTAGNTWGSVDISYDGSEAQTRGGMWLDRWNNQHCACINLAYLNEKGLDISQITSFSVPNGENISAVYLTNYAAGKAVSSAEGWGSCTGDYVRENALLSEGKYGTVALTYGAAVSGAKLYTVDSFDAETGLVLAENVDGIAEAGVPYFYMACDFEGHNASGGNKGTNSNVNFYRIDKNVVSGDWSADGVGNGLVGCYKEFGYPDALVNGTSYILKNNKIYYIDEKVTVGANRCFFDASKCTNKNSSTAKVLLGVDNSESTAIKNINNALNSDKIYDMNGREVKSMKKGGMYIMGGMKVYVK